MVIGKQRLEEQVQPTTVVLLVFLLLIKGTSIHIVAMEKRTRVTYSNIIFVLPVKAIFFCIVKLGWSEVLTSVVTLDNQVHYFYPALRVESSFWFSYSLFN